MQSGMRGILDHCSIDNEEIQEGSESQSMFGIDQNGSLHFSRLPKDFDIYNNNRFDIPAESYSGALAFLTADSKAVDIWYPV